MNIEEVFRHLNTLRSLLLVVSAPDLLQDSSSLFISSLRVLLTSIRLDLKCLSTAIFGSPDVLWGLDLGFGCATKGKVKDFCKSHSNLLRIIVRLKALIIIPVSDLRHCAFLHKTLCVLILFPVAVAGNLPPLFFPRIILTRL